MSYPTGLDYVWLSTDSQSCLAIFITAGEAPIPSCLLNKKPSLEGIEKLVWKLPEITESRLLVKVKSPDDYLAFAKRGLFVYDWTDINRTQKSCINMYEMVAQPVHACMLKNIPSDLSSSIVNIAVKNFMFSENSTIDISTYIQCTRP